MKELERVWKGIWLAIFCRVIRLLHRAPPEPDWGQGPHRILFLRPDRIGDAIVSTGIFRAIVTRVPNVTLDALASTANEVVLSADPHLATVHRFDRRRWRSFPRLVRELRARRYDGVIDCMVTAPSMTCLLLMLATGARHRIGIAGRGVDSALTLAVTPDARAAHIIDHMTAFAGVFGIGFAEADWRPGLQVPPEDTEWAMRAWGGAEAEGRSRVLVNVSAGRASRNWPEERFAAIVEYLRGRLGDDMECLVIGAPSERERVERIAALVGARPVSTPRFPEAVALVATATFLLTPDTSVAHVASAVGTPAVAMYLSGTSRQWGLIGDHTASVESDGDTLSSLPVETVLQAVDRVISGLRGSQASGPTRTALR